MKKLIFLGLTLTVLYSCDLIYKSKEKPIEEIEVIEEANTKEEKSSENKFTQTEFRDRVEEIRYIRKYLRYKIAEILIEVMPDKMKKLQYKLEGMGIETTLMEATQSSAFFTNNFGYYMYLVEKENLSFIEVKNKVENGLKERLKESERYYLERRIEKIDPIVNEETIDSTNNVTYE